MTIILLPLLSTGQVLHYDIIKGSKVIGSLEAAQSYSGRSSTISIRSFVEYRLLISFSVDFQLNETFNQGILISGDANNTLNGVTQKESTIKRNGEGYVLMIGGNPNEISESIDYSVAEVYFREPKNEMKAFSQHFGRFLPFEKVDANTYRLDSPDGENLYTYNNGVCVKVEIARDFGRLVFKMKPETYARVKERADTLQIK